MFYIVFFFSFCQVNIASSKPPVSLSIFLTLETVLEKVASYKKKKKNNKIKGRTQYRTEEG